MLLTTGTVFGDDQDLIKILTDGTGLSQIKPKESPKGLTTTLNPFASIGTQYYSQQELTDELEKDLKKINIAKLVQNVLDKLEHEGKTNSSSLVFGSSETTLATKIETKTLESIIKIMEKIKDKTSKDPIKVTLTKQPISDLSFSDWLSFFKEYKNHDKNSSFKHTGYGFGPPTDHYTLDALQFYNKTFTKSDEYLKSHPSEALTHKLTALKQDLGTLKTKLTTLSGKLGHLKTTLVHK
jgi:hypothetical protein